MCGIFGFNWEDRVLTVRGLDAIKHRGPDDRGIYSDKNVSLGHNRLSIIDLSKAGKQPMTNEDGTIFIIYNGEIYNYKQLKNSLKEKHSFKSNSDTEVMLHLYEEIGFDMVNKLEGMFAFCIYDSKKKILFIARDKAGIKPLYFYEKGKDFMFASEIKAMLENTEIKRELNKNALSSYLMFRANTSDQTFFKNIFKLKAGHFLVYNLKNSTYNVKKYWDYKIDIKSQSFNAASEKLRNLLDDSVSSQLMSDVPYGAFLSGGVDSGAVVSLMSRHVSSPVKTFSVGFSGEDSETSKSRFLSEEIGTDHHELILEEDSIKNLPQVVYHGDEPMADPTAIPTYLLSKYTKRYCTVVLTGEGADEALAGYPQYRFMKLHNTFIRKTPKVIRTLGIKSARIAPSNLLSKGFSYAAALGDKGLDRFENYLKSNSYAEQYLEQVSIFNENEQKELLNQSQHTKSDIYKKYDKSYFSNVKNENLIGHCQKLDFKESMVDDLLMKLDKNGMAFSIEGRVPFLDSRIVELGSSLKDSTKFSLLKEKILLRDALKNTIPEETRKRKKRHFFVPIDKWIHSLSDIREDLLSSNHLKKQNIFNHSYVEKMNREFKKSKLFYSRQLWSLLVFQIWHKQFMEGENVKI